jgi:hypothetical protein
MFINQKPAILNKIAAEIRREKSEKLQLRGQQVHLLADRVTETLEAGQDPKKLLHSEEFSELDTREQMSYIRRATREYQQFKAGKGVRFDSQSQAEMMDEIQANANDPYALSLAVGALQSQYAGNKEAQKHIRYLAVNANRLSRPENDPSFSREMREVATSQGAIGSLSTAAADRAKTGFTTKFVETYRMPADQLYENFGSIIGEQNKGKMMPFLPNEIKEEITRKLAEPYKTVRKSGGSGVRTEARQLSKDGSAVAKEGEVVMVNGIPVTVGATK